MGRKIKILIKFLNAIDDTWSILIFLLLIGLTSILDQLLWVIKYNLTSDWVSIGTKKLNWYNQSQFKFKKILKKFIAFTDNWAGWLGGLVLEWYDLATLSDTKSGYPGKRLAARRFRTARLGWPRGERPTTIYNKL